MSPCIVYLTFNHPQLFFQALYMSLQKGYTGQFLGNAQGATFVVNLVLDLMDDWGKSA